MAHPGARSPCACRWPRPWWPAIRPTALAFSPDVVFLDLGMPHLNGLDLARQMRAHPALAAVRLVALSGWGTDDDRAKSRDPGMDRHLTKPVLLDEVETMLAGWVRA